MPRKRLHFGPPAVRPPPSAVPPAVRPPPSAVPPAAAHPSPHLWQACRFPAASDPALPPPFRRRDQQNPQCRHVRAARPRCPVASGGRFPPWCYIPPRQSGNNFVCLIELLLLLCYCLIVCCYCYMLCCNGMIVMFELLLLYDFCYCFNVIISVIIINLQHIPANIHANICIDASQIRGKYEPNIHVGPNLCFIALQFPLQSRR
jgi:hypothetical protein